jgi:hypothetical protein
MVNSSYHYQVEYMGDKIKIRDIIYSGLSFSTIWQKHNGKYYSSYGFLMMSIAKDTSYVFPISKMILPVKKKVIIRKISENLYSNEMYEEFTPHYWELVYAVFYDKSYRIIKFQSMLTCDFVPKR